MAKERKEPTEVAGALKGVEVTPYVVEAAKARRRKRSPRQEEPSRGEAVLDRAVAAWFDQRQPTPEPGALPASVPPRSASVSPLLPDLPGWPRPGEVLAAVQRRQAALLICPRPVRQPGPSALPAAPRPPVPEPARTNEAQRTRRTGP